MKFTILSAFVLVLLTSSVASAQSSVDVKRLNGLSYVTVRYIPGGVSEIELDFNVPVQICQQQFQILRLPEEAQPSQFRALAHTAVGAFLATTISVTMSCSGGGEVLWLEP